MSEIYYKNIFLFASPQFSGNIIEYFVEHSEKLIVYITMSRFENKHNLVRQYKKGKLISENSLISSGNFFLYYSLWYFTFIWCLFRYYSKDEKVFVIMWHPIFFFGKRLLMLFRKVQYVFWIGDYFPPISLPIKLYEGLKRYYALTHPYVCFLSDRINKKINGKIVNEKNKKTIMWGVRTEEKKIARHSKKDICFVGVLKHSQGIETMLKVIKETKDLHLKMLGSSTDDISVFYRTMIREYKIEERVTFKNKMYYGKQLEKELQSCFLGISLYDVDKMSATYYADPGKIKTYMQYGLPVLMTPIADVEKYVRRFHAGEIVDQNIKKIVFSIKKIQRNYRHYYSGVKQFNKYFNYETYYKDKFLFLED